MLSKIASAGLLGIDAFTIDIETDVGLGLPSYNLVGLPDNAVREGFVRVRAAMENAGFGIPPRRVTINLAPADVRKDGAAFDLPIALSLLVALGVLSAESLGGCLCYGELGLDGRVRRVPGALPVAIHARRAGFRRLILPAPTAPEAAVVEGIEIVPVATLNQAVAVLRGDEPVPPLVQGSQRALPLPPLDLSEVQGNEHPKRALEIAAAGGHNILFIGPPGTGKSMLARRLPGLLPPLRPEEALETTAIYSSAGLLGGGGLIERRPFRAPHHDISLAGLCGGGSIPRPGEVSLAHHGVLFLDELPEFKRPALEALRQPLEDRSITVVRARCAVTYPAAFALVGAMNPCPCGYLGSGVRNCTCDLRRRAQYMARLSGPLIDRFDLHVEVPHVAYQTLLQGTRSGESTTTVAARVLTARERQIHRNREYDLRGYNADLRPEQVLRLANPGPVGERLLTRYARRHALSARSLYRVLRVARTIADLVGAATLSQDHLAEALTLRVLDREDFARAKEMADELGDSAQQRGAPSIDSAQRSDAPSVPDHVEP